MEYEYDDGDYYSVNWGNSDYQGDHPLGQANFEENENNYPHVR